MKKISILILLSIIFTSSVGAQCYSLNYRDFDLEDFIISEDEDTARFSAYFLSYHQAGEDTISAIRIINTKDRQHNQAQISVVKKQESMREIQSQRVAFFTKEMSLTPEEAQVFWPLYNQYTEKKNKLVEEQKKMMKSFVAERISTMTDSEAKTAANAFIKLQQEENDLAQEYHTKFMQHLSAKKVLQMYKAEKDFMQNLLWHLKGPRKGKE